MIALAFIAAAGFGAAVRHAVNLHVGGWRATLAVNIAGAFLLGALVGSEPSSSAFTVVGVGFLGTLTTFSMFALEVAEGDRYERLAIVTVSIVGGLGAAALGFALA